jgi:hypothetical protein
MNDLERPGRAPADAAFDPEDDEGALSWSQLQHYLHAPLRRPLAVLLPWPR